MRNFLTFTCAALLLAGAAFAQHRDPYGNPAPPAYGQRGPGYDVPGRVLSHLDQIRGGGHWDRGDVRRVEHARADLFRFRDEMARGRFNRGKLDSAIENLDHLARSYRVPPREREWFQRDVAELREFRARGWDRR